MIKNYLTNLKQEFSGYNTAKLMKDIMAGLTVCAVALPLALAFGVSSVLRQLRVLLRRLLRALSLQYSAALRSRFPAPQAR